LAVLIAHVASGSIGTHETRSFLSAEHLFSATRSTFAENGMIWARSGSGVTLQLSLSAI
jgi:hypothetical protein